MNNLRVNDEINWSSAAGDLTGKIVEIFLCMNAAQNLVPWAKVEVKYPNGTRQRTILNLLPNNIAMMKIAKVGE